VLNINAWQNDRLLICVLNGKYKCKNIWNCHNLPPPITTTTTKKRETGHSKKSGKCTILFVYPSFGVILT
jgi:hypothetical protein